MKTVLIVDDNATLAYFTARSLQQEMADVEVITSASCREARAKAAQSPPSVLIADLKLPDGDGGELVRELSESFPGMRAIIISGNELPKDATDCVFGSLKKPYGQEVLLSLVRRALDRVLPLESEIAIDGTIQQIPAMSAGYDRHYVRNRFAALLAGLRALQGDLKADANNPPVVTQLAIEHVERLFGIATELADIIKQHEISQGASHD